MSAWESEALAELRALVDQYALAMDGPAIDVLERLFVPDGTLVVKDLGRERPAAVFEGPGPTGIGLLVLLMRRHYRATMHHITTHHAAIDGQRASGRTYCIANHMLEDEQGTVETLAVRYQEDFVRTEAGWRFRAREVTRMWSRIERIPREPLLLDRLAAERRRKPAG